MKFSLQVKFSLQFKPLKVVFLSATPFASAPPVMKKPLFRQGPSRFSALCQTKVRPYSKLFPENTHIQDFLKNRDLIATDFHKKSIYRFVRKKVRPCEN